MTQDPKIRMGELEQLNTQLRHNEWANLRNEGIHTVGDVQKFVGGYRDHDTGRRAFQRKLGLSLASAQLIFELCLPSL